MVKIFITNVSEYTKGNLKGEWIELPTSPKNIENTIKRVLGKDEEIFITDYTAPFPISEYKNISELNELLLSVENIENDPEIIEALFKTSTLSTKETIQKIIDEDYIIIEVTNDAELIDNSDIAMMLYDEGYINFLGEISDSLYDFIDWDQVWRECNISYNWESIYIKKSGRQFAVNI